MKKLVEQVLILGLLAAWAMIAISSSQAPSYKCNAEWKAVFETSTSTSVNSSTDRHPESVTEMYYPGLKSLILQ